MTEVCSHTCITNQIINLKMNKTIKKARSTYDMGFSAAIIITGALTAGISTSGAITLMGIFFIAVGLVCWFILKSAYIDLETSRKLKKAEVFYPVDYKQNLLNAVMNTPEQLSSFPQSPMNTLKLSIYYNEDDMYLQLFEYIPCEYKPCTRLVKHKTCDISKLVH